MLAVHASARKWARLIGTVLPDATALRMSLLAKSVIPNAPGGLSEVLISQAAGLEAFKNRFQKRFEKYNAQGHFTMPELQTNPKQN